MILNRLIIKNYKKGTLCLFFIFFVIGACFIAFKYLYPDRNTEVKLAANSKDVLFLTKYEKGVPYKINIKTVYPNDSVKILGVSEDYLYWAETSDGQRGWIAPEAFDKRAFLLDNKELTIRGAEEGADKNRVSYKDTLTVISRGAIDDFYDIDIMTVMDSKGTVYEKVTENMIPVLAVEKNIYTVKNKFSGIDYYKFFTKEKFEKEFIGGDYYALDSKYYCAAFVTKKAGVTTAIYPFKVFDKATGCFYRPTLTIVGGYYQSVEYDEFDSYNHFILKWMPLVSQVIDCGIFAPLLDVPVYEEVDDYRLAGIDPGNQGPVLKILCIILIIIMALVFFFVYFTAIHVVPFFFFGLLLFEKPLKFLGDKGVIIISIILEVLSIYLWSILLMADNYYWWFILPVLILSVSWAIKSFKEFFDAFPYNRCFDCRRNFTYKFDRTITIRNYLQWRKSTEMGGVIGINTYKYQTYDLYSDGSRRNFQTHTKKQKIRQYDVYNVLLDITEYQDIFKCSKCGDEIKSSIYERRVEKERKYLSSYSN